MPQMSPMFWLTLMMFFMASVLFSWVKMYYL